MIKASKITLGLFSSGFILFSLYKYFSQKRISKEQISKIIKRISNLSIYMMFQYYDSKNEITNQKKETEEKINEKNNTGSKENLDNEILYLLLQVENEELKSLEITKEEFQEYLIKYKEEDIKIEKNYNLIQKVFNSLKQRKLPEINFGFIIPEKYLQIISNIFYFNIKKTYPIYYNKINMIITNKSNELNIKEKKEIFNDIYNTNIKDTRNEICYFFGIDKDNNLEINPKLALKIFPYYYDKNHSLRKKYQEINKSVNMIINKIIKIEYKIDVLTNENNRFNIKEPIDKIINFDDILNNIGYFSINDEEIPYEDQYD